MWRIWAPLPRGTWTPPGPGTEPMSPALAGRLPTSGPPGKSASAFLSKAPFPHLGNAAIAVAKFLVAEHCGWLPSGFRSLPSLALLAHGVFLIWSPCQTPLALPDPKVQPSASLVAHLCSRPTGPFLAVQLIASRAEAPRGAVPQLQVHTCEAPVAFSSRGSSDQTHARQIYLTRTLSLPFFLPSFSPSLPSHSLPSFLSLFLSRVSFQKMGILFFHLIQSQILAPPLSLFFLSLFVFTAHNQPSANVVTSVPRQAHPNLFPSPRLLPSPGPHLIPDCHHPLEKTLMLGLKVGEKGTTEDEMAGWHHRLKGRESE